MTLKKSILGMILAAILSAALTYAITLKTLNNTMHVTGIQAVNIEKPLGTPIQSYDWGVFSEINQSKTETFHLRNVGNEVLNLNATITDLPAGWTATLSTTEWVIPPSETANFTMTLTLTEAIPTGDYTFNLNFSTT